MKRFLAILTVICIALCFLTACEEKVEEPEPSPTPVIISEPTESKLPDIELEYDETKFVMEGVVLVAYIGGEEAVEIPDGTMVIGANAFERCHGLGRAGLPACVKEIQTDVSELILDYLSAHGTVAFPDRHPYHVIRPES